MEQEIAPTLGTYSILKELYQDAWGIVYKAVRTRDKAPMLLRVISPELSNNENFILRFDLLKTILPSIKHDNLVKIDALDCDNNIYFIAKELPAPGFQELRTMDKFDARETSNHQSTLLLLFKGIAEGLGALESVSKSYYKNGITHDFLSLDRIYISLEKSLIGQHGIPSPKVDGYCESFLFFGEHHIATQRHHLAPALHKWQNIDEDYEATSNGFGLYDQEGLFPPQGRRGLSLDHSFTQYSFGALAYHYFTKKYPRGVYPPLREIDPTLDPIWEEIVDRCLSAPHGEGYPQMKDISAKLQELSVKRKQLAPNVRKLEDLPVPPGMALVSLNEKVELGASDGPLVEQPSFKARVKSFFIDIAPVTCKQFSEFQDKYQSSTYSSGDDHPATLVTWHMAKAYCQWRSQREGLDPDTYRLPTEYEWEAAVRGSTGFQFPWGEEQDSTRLHCSYDESRGSFPVKQLLPGRFGLHDMLGNVWEWTESHFLPHPFSKHVSRSYSSILYTVKGGCWYTPYHSCRASLRAAFRPSDRRGNVGFRCVLPIDLEEKES